MDKTAGGISPAMIDPGEIRRAQLGEFARLTPINTFVTVSVSTCTALILRNVSSRPWLIAWLLAQVLPSLLLLARWLRRKNSAPPSRPVGIGTIRRATRYALLAGLTWGALPLLMRDVTSHEEMAVCIIVTAMAAGSATTLAAIPAAAMSFVLAAILPFVVYFAAKDDPAYALLALLALCFTVAMVVAARQLHGTFLAAVRTRLENAEILERFYGERQDWIEVSETTDAFALLDGDERLLLWNQNLAAFLSLPPGGLVRGAPFRDLLRRGAAPIDPPAGEGDLWIDALLGSGGENRPAEPAARGFDNGLWLRARVRRTARGNVTVVFTDVTALKASERTVLEREAALAASRRLEAVGKLAGGVAHDFNNLLTAISGFAETLASDSSDRPAAHHAATRIVQAAERAASLTRQLLAFGRRQALQPRVVDLNALVEETHELLARLVPPEVEVRLELHPRPLPIHVDPTTIERALVNLVTNARDTMPGGGHVVIRTHEVERASTAPTAPGVPASAAWAVVAVKDDGPGMDAQTRARIFEPFFAARPDEPGAGLALATVYGSVVQSGGIVEVDSETGRGTTFRILLPRTDRADDAAVSPPPQAARVEDDRAVILLVEDETVVRELVGEVLTRSGRTVLPASRPLAALEICRNHPGRIDLILSDVVMPEMSGPAFVARALRILPGTPVIYMSGYADDALGTHGIVDPGVSLLRKPFTSAELCATVAEELAKSSASRRSHGT